MADEGTQRRNNHEFNAKGQDGHNPQDLRDKLIPLQLQTYMAIVDRALAIKNDLEEQYNVDKEPFRAPSYGGQENRNSGNVKPVGRDRGNLQGNAEKPRMQGRAYALKSQEVRDTSGVIEGTLTIFQCVARVLFDPGSTISFISSYMVPMLPQEPELLPYVLEVSTPLGESTLVSLIYKSCAMIVGEHTVYADLIILPMRGFDILLRMDCLSSNRVSLDHLHKVVIFTTFDGESCKFQGRKDGDMNIILAI
ncbi:hypothetical protein RJ639_012837 [Escallonia herrerae]|uniref:Gag-pol polyprotein n=1 Tax=Escallonia herrerae TaxID=1293975 RepID=A0AA88VJF5_9ASTE|nr:hypothetical protein RJ639_012837 [Escallonia herrerae]